ncbi:MAG: hypothetical protein IIA61_08670 [Candidatus Marinimicrobia bacterium]|nr:hypothetical protein [Candidatus Neomarinimicrobiota bacterium]
MAIIVKTQNPSGLLSKIKKAINDKSIDTWSYDSDGDFTHKPEQWKNKAWLRPKVYSNELRFGILGQKDTELTKYLYGVYHGRFIEMLLNHFDSDFNQVQATAVKTEPDYF